jgi:hypothetical protein
MATTVDVGTFEGIRRVDGGNKAAHETRAARSEKKDARSSIPGPRLPTPGSLTNHEFWNCT